MAAKLKLSEDAFAGIIDSALKKQSCSEIAKKFGISRARPSNGCS